MRIGVERRTILIEPIEDPQDQERESLPEEPEVPTRAVPAPTLDPAA